MGVPHKLPQGYRQERACTAAILIVLSDSDVSRALLIGRTAV